MKNRMVQAALLLFGLMAFVLIGCASDAQTNSEAGTIVIPRQKVPERRVLARAAQEQAAREQAAQEQAAREQAAQEQAAREQAAQEQAAREQAAREQAAREQAAREQAAAYKIGDTGPTGGIVFYVKDDNSNGWRYLEAAPAETEQKSRGFHSAEIFRQYKVNDWRLGAGRENTRKFIAFFEQKGGGINTPMWICDNLVVNGFDDWYLPSSEELLCMYYNLYKQGLGDFKTMWYLSSTAVNERPNIAINFASGRETDRSGGEVGVRAVRQF